jgi:hypothetical protein
MLQCSNYAPAVASKLANPVPRVAAAAMKKGGSAAQW